MSNAEVFAGEEDLYTGARADNYLERRHEEFPWLYIESGRLEAAFAQTYDKRGDVLVVGPGPGTTDLRVALQHVPQNRVWVVEPSPRFAEILRGSFPDVTVVQGKLQDVQLPSERFNLAVAGMVYQHLGRVALPRALAGLYNALEPEGQLLSMAINHEWLGYVATQRGLSAVPTDTWVRIPYTWSDGVPLGYHNWTIDSLVDLHRQAGLTVSGVEYLDASEAGKLASPVDYEHGMHPYRARVAILAQRQAA